VKTVATDPLERLLRLWGREYGERGQRLRGGWDEGALGSSGCLTGTLGRLAPPVRYRRGRSVLTARGVATRVARWREPDAVGAVGDWGVDPDAARVELAMDGLRRVAEELALAIQAEYTKRLSRRKRAAWVGGVLGRRGAARVRLWQYRSWLEAGCGWLAEALGVRWGGDARCERRRGAAVATGSVPVCGGVDTGDGKDCGVVA
jgi:hypothetical protein